MNRYAKPDYCQCEDPTNNPLCVGYCLVCGKPIRRRSDIQT